MRYVCALLIAAVPLASLCSAAATKVEKKPFFRERGKPAARKTPKAFGDPVATNAASYLPGVSPGGLATIFGQDLTTVTGTILSSTNPFPTQMAGVSVVVNGVLAPLFSIAYVNGEDQISFQVPYDTPTGPGSVEIQVLNDGNVIATLVTDSYTEDPGIFGYYVQGVNYAVAEHGSDGALVGPDDPAVRGEVLVLYTTGLGPLSLNLIDGLGAPSYPNLAYTLDPFQVVVQGEPCSVLFSGLAPGYVGLYQINIQLPPDLPAGNLDIQILSDYANSQVVSLPVR